MMQRKNRQVRRWRQCFWDTEFTRELLAKEFDEAIPLAQLKEGRLGTIRHKGTGGLRSLGQAGALILIFIFGVFDLHPALSAVVKPAAKAGFANSAFRIGVSDVTSNMGVQTIFPARDLLKQPRIEEFGILDMKNLAIAAGENDAHDLTARENNARWRHPVLYLGSNLHNRGIARTGIDIQKLNRNFFVSRTFRQSIESSDGYFGSMCCEELVADETELATGNDEQQASEKTDGEGGPCVDVAAVSMNKPYCGAECEDRRSRFKDAEKGAGILAIIGIPMLIMWVALRQASRI